MVTLPVLPAAYRHTCTLQCLLLLHACSSSSSNAEFCSLDNAELFFVYLSLGLNISYTSAVLSLLSNAVYFLCICMKVFVEICFNMYILLSEINVRNIMFLYVLTIMVVFLYLFHFCVFCRPQVQFNFSSAVTINLNCHNENFAISIIVLCLVSFFYHTHVYSDVCYIFV